MIQIRIHDLAEYYAGRSFSASQLRDLLGSRYPITAAIVAENAKQLNFTILKSIVEKFGIDPGDCTIAEFFTFEGVRRRVGFYGIADTYTPASKYPMARLRVRSLAANYHGSNRFACFGFWTGEDWQTVKGEIVPRVSGWRGNDSVPWRKPNDPPPIGQRVQIQAQAIMTPYALQQACGFSVQTVAIGLWRETGKRLLLDNLEKLIRGLELDPARTALSQLFDFGPIPKAKGKRAKTTA